MNFPFGQPLRELHQLDQSPKRVFVLGVYASAVHARWRKDGKDIVKALAVASEPCIFWNGDGAAQIISRITIPYELGELLPAAAQFNGPSGRALDECILAPLGMGRKDVWLCDLVPHSCVNGSQKKAIQSRYDRHVGSHGLTAATVPEVPEKLTDQVRRDAILAELHRSEAKTLILLGDEPIRWFLRFYCDCPTKLAGFDHYGRLHRFLIAGRDMNVLPLAHPRQTARLGMSSSKWFELHRQWCSEFARSLKL